ncbi:class I SAM-dependent methyltransferase [Sphingomonas arenae]|uniref:class I SAM-dependent methyltransferase n=1 Tax=Sphingomonas arenae TaxID=2812555 RepID=UPI001F476F70|nr:class I SAM-dependent methyltransferase [Sphingomonas arenae]
MGKSGFGVEEQLAECRKRFAELFDRYWLDDLPRLSPEKPDEGCCSSNPEHAGKIMLDKTSTPAFDEAKLQEFMGKLVGDAGAAATAPLVVLGDRLGLYKALAASEGLTSDQLADATGTHERYVREWLAAQAAAGYITYDAAEERYGLTPEQALAFADEDSPVFFVGSFEILCSNVIDSPKIEQAFRTGAGVGWHEHDQMLFCGCERFFRSGYVAHLVADWLPALDGMVERMEQGASVADVGCGHGASTIIMAEAFPNSTFIGFDYHAESIEHARAAAEKAGVADRVRFEVASAQHFPGEGFDLVTIFDALHDMGDPAGAARQIRQALKPDGTLMIVEPLAGDRLEDNLNPVGRLYYASSTMICTPASLAQEVGLGLGAQAGERRLREVLESAGFTQVRRATETPFNMVLEVRP